jgi:hypothetical protein
MIFFNYHYLITFKLKNAYVSTFKKNSSRKYLRGNGAETITKTGECKKP